MKKLIAIVLSMLLVLAMAACAASAPAQPYIPPVANGTNPPAASGESTAPTGSVAVPVLPGQQEQAPTTEATEPQTETEPQATEGTPVTPGQQETLAPAYIEPGKDDGYHYSNYSIGLEFYAPEGFTYETQEQLMTRNGMPAGADWNAVNDKAATTAVTVMQGQTQDGTSANANVQRLTYEQVEAMDFKASLESQIDSLVSAYKAMGFDNVQCEYGKMEISRKEVDALLMTADIRGQTFYVAVMQYGINDLVVSVTIGSLNQTVAEEMLESLVLG